MGKVLSKVQHQVRHVEEPDPQMVIEIPSTSDGLKITAPQPETEEIQLGIPIIQRDQFDEEEEQFEQLTAFEHFTYYITGNEKFKARQRNVIIGDKYVEYEEYERVNPFIYLFYFVMLCCRPVTIRKLILPAQYVQRSTIVVEFPCNSRSYSKKKRSNCLTHCALLMKHLLERCLVKFGFRNLTMKPVEPATAEVWV